MDAELGFALALDKLGTAGLLGLMLYVLWGRYTKSSDTFVATLTAKLDGVVAKLGDIEATTKIGLAGVANKLDEHHRRIAEAERRLDRHSDLLRALPDRSGPVPRPRVVGEEADRS